MNSISNIGVSIYPRPTATAPSINVNGTLTPRRDEYWSVLVITTPDPKAPVNAEGRDYHPASDIKIYTGHADDTIDIKVINNRIVAVINGISVKLDMDASSLGKLHIETGGGNDKVTIAPDVKVAVNVDTGPGQDTVNTGGGYSEVHLGEGNDKGSLGPGGGVLYGEDGDDTIEGGPGNNFLLGGAGTNTIKGGTPSDSSHTWMIAEGTRDTLEVRADHTSIDTKSQFTSIRLHREFDVQLKIFESAGNTETIEHQDSRGRPAVWVNYTRRNDPTKDRRIRANAPD